MLEVVAGLIRQGNKALICQRPENKARALCWEFPGGKVEKGETLHEALRRECREELDIDLDVGEVLTDTVYEYPDVTVHLSLLCAVVREGTPRALEHRDIRFVSPEEFPGYSFCPADQRFLEAAREFLQSDPV